MLKFIFPNLGFTFERKKTVINYTVYENNKSAEWVTFVHGAGGSSAIWFKQIRDFQNHYNILLLDLRGHGESKKSYTKKYTFSGLADDIYEVLDFLSINKSHFVGISLGTILIRQLAETYPDRVQSMVLGGAILKMNFRAQVLMRLGTIFKQVLPYMLLYRFFAFVILPKRKHKIPRQLFINEAKKVYQKEFVKWFKLTKEINPVLSRFRKVELNIPTLYIMGDEDYMFLPSVKEVSDLHFKSSVLVVIDNCGHVVNIEKATVFNEKALYFLNNMQ